MLCDKFVILYNVTVIIKQPLAHKGLCITVSAHFRQYIGTDIATHNL